MNSVLSYSPNPEHLIRIQESLSLLGKENRSTREMRSLILGLEEVMRQMPEHLTAKDFDTRHHFEQGVYMRELHIPKGTTLTGRIHKTGHLNILSQGKLTVWTENGMKTLSASTTIQSKPGIKRVGYAHEDSVWITVHHNPDDERDIKKVEARLFADTFQEAYLASQRTFEDAIHFLGFTNEEVKDTSENAADQTDFLPTLDVYLHTSSIHGQGVFANKTFEAGQVIGSSRHEDKRTPLGRYCNHSGDPNAEMVMRENGDVDLIARRPIQLNEEILNDYYLTYMNTRKGDELCLL